MFRQLIGGNWTRILTRPSSSVTATPICNTVSPFATIKINNTMTPAQAFACPHGIENQISLSVSSSEGTEKVARTIARYFNQPGDVILLYGDLGVGKTAFARGFIRAVTNMPHLNVPSPTFTLDVTYTHDNIKVHHMDLYRIQPTILPNGLKVSPGIEVLGIPNVFSEDVCVVEWPDRLHNSDVMPTKYIRVFIEDESHGEVEDESGERRITVSVVGQDHGARADAMLRDVALCREASDAEDAR